MTPTALADGNLVYQASDYYAKMRRWFEPHKNHPLVAALELALQKEPFMYARLKMNGYASPYDDNGKIVQSKVYDRTGFPAIEPTCCAPTWRNYRRSPTRASFVRSFRPTEAVQDADRVLPG